MGSHETKAYQSIKYLQFSGKCEDWDKWSTQFKCIAAKKKYLDALLGVVESPRDEEKSLSKAIVQAKKANQDGSSDMLMSVSDTAFKMVNMAKPPDLLSGDLCKAWKDLCSFYDR
jgi:hypothetical protein